MADGVVPSVAVEVLGPDDVVRLALADDAFGPAVRRVDVPAGANILDLLEAAGISPRKARRCVVLIEGAEVPQDRWLRVRPKPGVRVTVGVRPAGGGDGSNPLRVILQLVVAVASAFLLATAGPIAAALVSALGNLAINALVPPPRVRQPDPASAPSYAVEDAGNELRLFGVAPVVLGRRRLVLLQAARPWTEVVGDDLHYRLLLTPGVGPATLTDLRVGATPIGDVEGIEHEIRTGAAGEAPVTLYANAVFETSPNADVTQAAGWLTRTTAEEADELSVDFTWPQGLVWISDRGQRTTTSVTVEIEWRRVGDTTWQSRAPSIGQANAAAEVAGEPRARGPTWGPARWNTYYEEINQPTLGAPLAGFSFSSNESRVVRRSVKWAVPRGRYDVRVRRVTADTTASQQGKFDAFVWTALRAVKAEPPSVPPGTPLVALRIKASDSLQGRIEPISAVVTSVRPAWTGSAFGAAAPTRNCADLFLSVLKGPGTRRPVPDSRIDYQSLADWAELCRLRNWTADLVIDDGRSVAEVLQAVASCGRARAVRRAGKIGVVVDVPRATTGQLYGPRNTRGFRARKRFTPAIHAVRVRFPNEERDFRDDERIVYADGYNAANATQFEQTQFEGLTNPARVDRETRRWLKELELRSVTYEFAADPEHLAAGVGDVCELTHDVILVGLGQARVVGLLDAAGNPLAPAATLAHGVQLDEAVTMEAGKTYGLKVRRPSGAVTFAIATTPGVTDKLTFGFTQLVVTAPKPDELAAFGETNQQTIEVVVLSKGRPDKDGVTPIVVTPNAQPVLDTVGETAAPPFVSTITQPWFPLLPAPTLVSALWREEGVSVVFDWAGIITQTTGFDVAWRETPPVGAVTEWAPLPQLGPTDRRFVTPPPRLAESVDLKITPVDLSGRRGRPLEILNIESSDAVDAPVVTLLQGLLLEGPGGSVPVLRAVVTPPPDSRLLALSAQVRPAGSTSDADWRGLAPGDPFNRVHDWAGAGPPGGAVQVRLRHETRRGAVSPWTTPATVLLPAISIPGYPDIAALGAAINTAGTTALWPNVTGAGRPADNATVGARAGLNLRNNADTVTLTDGDVITAQGTAADFAGRQWGATATEGQASNARVPIGSNSIVNSEFARGVYAWAPGWNGSTGAGVAQTIEGTERRALRAAANGSWPNGGAFEIGSGGPDSRYWLPVKAGDRVFASALLAFNSACLTAQVNIHWYNRNGVYLGEVATNGGAANSSPGNDPANYSRVTHFATAPANAAFANLRLRAGTNGGASPVAWAMEAMLCLVEASQTQAPLYVAGRADVIADRTGDNTAADFVGRGPWATVTTPVANVLAPQPNLFPFPSPIQGGLWGGTTPWPGSYGWAGTSLDVGYWQPFGGDIYIRARPSGGAAVSEFFFFDVPNAVAGQQYTVSLNGYVTGGTFNPYAECLNGAKGWLAGFTMTADLVSGRWRVTFTAPTSTAWIRVVIQASFNASAGYQDVVFNRIKVEHGAQMTPLAPPQPIAPRQAGADVTPLNTAADFAGRGVLATRNDVDSAQIVAEAVTRAAFHEPAQQVFTSPGVNLTTPQTFATISGVAVQTGDSILLLGSFKLADTTSSVLTVEVRRAGTVIKTIVPDGVANGLGPTVYFTISVIDVDQPSTGTYTYTLTVRANNNTGNIIVDNITFIAQRFRR